MHPHVFARLLLVVPASFLAGCAEQENPIQAPGIEARDQSFAPEIAGEFTIVKTAGEDRAASAATNGTSYLVGYGNGAPSTVKARLVTAPNTLGAVSSTNRQGDAPFVAFDGANYLMIWT